MILKSCEIIKIFKVKINDIFGFNILMKNFLY